MSSSRIYPETEFEKILAVIKASAHNPSDAHRLLTVAAQKDSQLMLALAAPFMKGIIAYAIDQARGRTAQAPAKIIGRSPDQTMPQPGSSSRRAPAKPPLPAKQLISEDQLSKSDKQAHAKSLNALADAFKKKK